MTIHDKSGSVALQTKTDDKGGIVVELPEYHVNGKEKSIISPYEIVVDGVRMEVELDGNKEVVFTIR